MSDNIESKGRTVEEAVSEALLQMGARVDEVDIKILDEGKTGFLGMFGGKPARVLVTRKSAGRGRRRGGRSSRARSEKGRPDAQRARQDRPRQEQPRQDRPRQDRSRQERSDRGRPARGRPDRSRPERGKPEGPRARSAQSPGQEPRGGPKPAGRATSAAEVDGRAQPVGPEVKAVTRAEPVRGIDIADAPAALDGIAAELMRLAGFPCRSEVQEGEYHLVKIVTDDSSAGMLIGRHGTTVDALEHLVERMASQAAGERVNMNLDVNNYRRRREENLVMRVDEIVGKVRRTGREVHMEPLCARERRIVHLEVAKIEGMRTYTVPTASGKHVVVAAGEPGEETAPAREATRFDEVAPEDSPRAAPVNSHVPGGDADPEDGLGRDGPAPDRE